MTASLVISTQGTTDADVVVKFDVLKLSLLAGIDSEDLLEDGIERILGLYEVGILRG
jgi:hypothetical protein